MTPESLPRNVRRVCAVGLALGLGSACVPAGNSTPSDAGASAAQPTTTAQPIRQSPNVMKVPFEDSFDRSGGVQQAAPTSAVAPQAPDSATGAAGEAGEAGEAGGEAATASTDNGGLGPDWHQVQTTAWHIENGKLCAQGAKNHGVWLKRVLPINAIIEFEAVTESTDGDLKTEVWGDGQSAATSISYTNATSYLAILGGWKNTFHVLARLNEHGADRKQIKVEPDTDDPREKPATAGQIYRVKIERRDGKTVRWFVNDLEYLSYPDPAPLAGIGHDHFGFNDWEVKVCFDNVRVTPLP